MTFKNPGLVAIVTAMTLWLVAPPAGAQVSPPLGNAASYSILSGSQVTNTGATTISGDVGVFPGIGPGPHVTGFGTVVLGGTIHDADVPAQNAQFDRAVAYGALDQGCTVTFPGPFKELAGATLVPGVYCATSFHLTGGALTLIGLPTDTWIFKSSSDLVVSGGAPARVLSPSCQVWWRVVSSASLDAGSSLLGNVLADTSITLAGGASIAGKALAGTAAVTLVGNSITACAASALPALAPSVSKAFSPASMAPGGVSRLTITLNNGNAAAIGLTTAFTDTLPAGLVIAAVPAGATTCGGFVAASAGGSTVGLPAASLLPSGSCTISINVTAAADGTYVNTIGAGALQTPSGSNAAPAGTTLTVTSPASVCNVPPSITAFSGQAIAVSGSVSLDFTIGGAVILDALNVRATSSNTTLVPENALVITKGVGGARVLTVSGADGRSGTATITVTVTDPTSGSTTCATSTTFQITFGVVPVSPVPTLPQWALIALAAVLALGGATAVHRRTA